MAYVAFLTNLYGLDGTLESGGLINSYVRNTSTRSPLFSDAIGTPYTTNPVVSDSLGQATFYYRDDVQYSWRATTADGGTTLWEADVVGGVVSYTFINEGLIQQFEASATGTGSSQIVTIEDIALVSNYQVIVAIDGLLQPATGGYYSVGTDGTDTFVTLTAASGAAIYVRSMAVQGLTGPTGNVGDLDNYTAWSSADGELNLWGRTAGSANRKVPSSSLLVKGRNESTGYELQDRFAFTKVVTGDSGYVNSWDPAGIHLIWNVSRNQAVYRNLAPTKLHYMDFQSAVSKGDNTGFKGVGHGYFVSADDSSVDTDGERGVLYGLAIAVQPRRDRNNAPSDDVACIVMQNDGTARATELLYFGRGISALSRECNAPIGIDTHADMAIFAVGAYNYGIDFSRGLASPATFTGSAVRVPNNVTAVSGRNAANNADIALLGINSSNQLTLAGKAVTAWASYTPTISASSGTITTAAPVSGECRWFRINNTIFLRAAVEVTTKGTGANQLLISLPAAALVGAAGTGRETASGRTLAVWIVAGESNARLTLYNGGDPIADGNFYQITISYEVA